MFLLLIVLIVPVMIGVCYYFGKGSPWIPSDPLPFSDPVPSRDLENSLRVSVLLLYLPDSDVFNEHVDRFRDILANKMSCQVYDLLKDYTMIQEDQDWLYTKVNECKVIQILSAKSYKCREDASRMDYSNLYFIGMKAARDKNESVMTVRFEDITEAPPKGMLKEVIPDRIYLLPKHFVKFWHDLHGVEPSEKSILERDIESIWGEEVFVSQEHNGACSSAPLI